MKIWGIWILHDTCHSHKIMLFDFFFLLSGWKAEPCAYWGNNTKFTQCVGIVFCCASEPKEKDGSTTTKGMPVAAQIPKSWTVWLKACRMATNPFCQSSITVCPVVLKHLEQVRNGTWQQFSLQWSFMTPLSLVFTAEFYCFIWQWWSVLSFDRGYS